MSLSIVVTNGGLAALAAAQANGTLPLVITKVGVSPTAITPVATMTVLAGETKKITTISGLTTDSKSAHITVRDETADEYTVKSFGLYLANGTLFGIYGQPDPIIVKTAVSVLNLAIDIQFAAITAASLSFGDTNFTNPDATTATKGVIEIATQAEVIAATDTTRAVTPNALWGAMTSWLTSLGVWRASNDGAGSGLDADLLDGLQGSDYVKKTDTATTTAAGIAALATAAETQAGAVANKAVTPSGFLSAFTALVAAFSIWRASNDGAGSGMDADLLDGQQGAWYGDIPARLGYTPANKAGDVFAGPIRRDANFYMDLVNGGPLLNLDVNDYIVFDRASNQLTLVIAGNSRLLVNAAGDVTAAGSLYSGSNAVWHSGNDGSGGGLDADLLDGQQGSYYTAIAARLGYTPANRAGDTFTGPIARDGSFYLNLAGTTPVISFDPDDYIAYDRTNNVIRYNISGAQRAYLTATGEFGVTGPMFANGGLVWHSANDGAGSGMDADLLAGQTAAYYTNIAARLGYTPANAAGQNFGGSISVAGNLVWHTGNDGAGGGLDADLLDGQQGSYYAAIAARLGYTPANAAGQDFTGAISVNGSPVWNAANDGSGSGLDADLLDGKDASQFVQTGGYVNNFNPNKGSRLAHDGYIENWVKVMCNGNDFVDIEWDRPFPNNIFTPVVTPMNSTADRDNGGAIMAYSKTGARVARVSPNAGQSENNYLFVRANGF